METRILYATTLFTEHHRAMSLPVEKRTIIRHERVTTSFNPLDPISQGPSSVLQGTDCAIQFIYPLLPF